MVRVIDRLRIRAKLKSKSTKVPYPNPNCGPGRGHPPRVVKGSMGRVMKQGRSAKGRELHRPELIATKL